MKNTTSRLKILCLCVALHTLTACEKEAPTPQTFFSFTYNKHQYQFGEMQIGQFGGAVGEEQQWLVKGDGSIWINRPDIFGLVISYGASNCTFLSPVRGNLSNLFGCQLTADSVAVDSIAVYFYKSGHNTYSLDDCFIKTGYDFVTGQNYSNTICVQNGTFDLELINNHKKVIRITNGRYRFTVHK